MSKTSKTVVEEFPDALVLAALDRAQRHARRGPDGPVVSDQVYWHLDVRRRSGLGRRLRLRLLALGEADLLERSRRHGCQVWQLTPAGRSRLKQAARTGAVPELPESPQHRDWRSARATAAQESERVRGELREYVEELLRLLDSGQLVSSDLWFGLGDRVGRLSWLLGSMTHCLHEWREPEDAHADIDDHEDPGDELLGEDERVVVHARRRGRRNPVLWRRRWAGPA